MSFKNLSSKTQNAESNVTANSTSKTIKFSETNIEDDTVKNEDDQKDEEIKNVLLLASSTGGEFESPKMETSSEDEVKELIDIEEAKINSERMRLMSRTLYPQEDDLCTVSQIRVRNTPSFLCLSQIFSSCSTLKNETLYLFPPLQNPGIEEVFDYREQPPSYDYIGVEKYQDTCKELNAVPFSTIVKNLGKEIINLRHYNITLPQFRALCDTLRINSIVKQLILDTNALDIEQCTMLPKIFDENETIRVLKMKHCRIGPKGADFLNQCLLEAKNLRELDISFNCLGNEGLQALEAGLTQNKTLKVLNLSHNNLDEESAQILERILIANENLEMLDLAWNSFYKPSNKNLFHGLTVNNRIKSLSLAWNAIRDFAAVAPIARYLGRTTNLIYFDISNNRLEGKSLMRMRGGLRRNKSLISLRIGNNPLTPAEAYSVAILLTDPKTTLINLDMKNIWFKKEIVPVLSKILNDGKKITIGGIHGLYEIKGPNVNKLLFERCRYLLMKPKKKKLKKDFGHFILNLPEGLIRRPKFDELLKTQKIKRLDNDLINELVNRFTVSKKRIDCTAMRNNYLELYPDTHLPEPKPKKKKGKKDKKKKKKAKASEEATKVDESKQEIRKSTSKVANNEKSVVKFDENIKSMDKIDENIKSMDKIDESKNPEENPVLVDENTNEVKISNVANDHNTEITTSQINN